MPSKKKFVLHIIDVCNRVIENGGLGKNHDEMWQGEMPEEFDRLDFDDTGEGYYSNKNLMVSHLAKVSDGEEREALIEKIAYFCLDRHLALPLKAAELFSSSDSLEKIKTSIDKLLPDKKPWPYFCNKFERPFVEIRGKALIEQNCKVNKIINEYNNLGQYFKLSRESINFLTFLARQRHGKDLLDEGKNCMEIIDKLGLESNSDLFPLYKLVIDLSGKQKLLESKNWQRLTEGLPPLSDEVSWRLKSMLFLDHGIDLYINNRKSRSELFTLLEITTLGARWELELKVVERLKSRASNELMS